VLANVTAGSTMALFLIKDCSFSVIVITLSSETLTLKLGAAVCVVTRIGAAEELLLLDTIGTTIAVTMAPINKIPQIMIMQIEYGFLKRFFRFEQRDCFFFVTLLAKFGVGKVVALTCGSTFDPPNVVSSTFVVSKTVS